MQSLPPTGKVVGGEEKEIAEVEYVCRNPSTEGSGIQ